MTFLQYFLSCAAKWSFWISKFSSCPFTSTHDSMWRCDTQRWPEHTWHWWCSKIWRVLPLLLSGSITMLAPLQCQFARRGPTLALPFASWLCMIALLSHPSFCFTLHYITCFTSFLSFFSVTTPHTHTHTPCSESSANPLSRCTCFYVFSISVTVYFSSCMHFFLF